MPPRPLLRQPPPAPDVALPKQGPLSIWEQIASGLQGAIGVNEPERGDFTDEASFNSAATPYAMGTLAQLLAPVMAAVKAARTGKAVATAEEGIAQPLKAYHGSPHDFDQFSSAKIGTGEGAQAYGHGLYFAENPGVAKEYRERLASPDLHVSYAGQRYIPNSQGIAAGRRHLLIQLDTVGKEEALDSARRYLKTLEGFARPEQLEDQRDLIKWFEQVDPSKVSVKQPGATYEVNLHTSPDELLDWDKPLSQQPQKVQEALKDAVGPARFERMREGDLAGHRVYEAIGGDYHTAQDVTDVMKQSGIKGIQYLDQGSRVVPDAEVYKSSMGGWHIQNGPPDTFPTKQAALDAAEKINPKTRNFVIFDDKIIEIAKKYGVALPVAAEIYRRQQAQIQGQPVNQPFTLSQ